MHHKILKVPAMAAGVMLALVATTAAQANSLAEIGGACAPQIHPKLLSAVVMHESRGNPLAIGINGGFRLPRQPANKAEAVATARWLAANGYNFDSGLGQINVKNLRRLGMSIEDLFDPCANLRAAATVLSDCYNGAKRVREPGAQTLEAALSCYNTGDYSRGVRNGYVGKVASRLGAVVPVGPLAARAQDVSIQALGPEATASAPGAEAPKAERRFSDVFGVGAGDAFSRTASENRPSITDQ